MKRLVIVLLAILICVPSIYGRRVRPKSGEIDDGVYKDAKYELKFNIHDNWKADLQKPDSDMRLELAQQDYEIPPELMNMPQKTRIPILQIFMHEVPDKTPAVFIDSITSYTYNSDVKDDLMQDIIVLEERVEYEGLKKTNDYSTKIDSLPAFIWEGTANFSEYSDMTTSFDRSFGVALIAVKHENNMLSFVVSCEGMYLPDIMKEVKAMAESIEWPAEKEK